MNDTVETATVYVVDDDPSIQRALEVINEVKDRRSTAGGLPLRSIICALAVTVPFATVAQSGKGGGDLRAAAQNPVSSVISLPFKFTFDYGAPNGEASIMNINPVIPVTVGDWNLVNRALIPLIDSPGALAGASEIPTPVPGTGTTGLGDINYSLFFSPVRFDRWIWGVGPSISLPTASNKQLGSGKWSAGPTAVVLTLPKWGSYGAVLRQLWSFAGSAGRPKVNQLLFEPFANYNLPGGWYVNTDMVMIANWDAPSGQKWTVPLGGGVGKLTTFGAQPVNLRAEAYYNVERPDLAPKWNLIFTVQFMFPK